MNIFHYLLLTAVLFLTTGEFTVAEAKSPLKIGTLPIHDTLLLHVAQREGYFADEGLEVELIAFHSALGKDSAARSGHLDGHFSDLSSVIIQRAGGAPFVVVASTSHTQPGARMFGLVTSPKSSAQKMEDLEDKDLAIAGQTIVDFLGNRLLIQAGYPEEFMGRLDIRKIPVRLQMLLSGQVEAAIFPEPLLTLVQEAGGRVLLDDRQLDMPLAFLALNQAQATPETVAGFRRALSRAGELINQNLSGQKDLLMELGLIPAHLADKFQQPPVDLNKIPHTLPSLELYQTYGRWLMKNGVLGQPDEASPGKLPPLPAYGEVVWGGNQKP